MNDHISKFQEIVSSTTLCLHDYACCRTGENGCTRCAIDYAVGDNLLFLNDTVLTPELCPYKSRFGYRYICRCPMQYALYRSRTTGAIKLSDVGVWISNEHDVIIEANKKMESMAGMSRERLLGTCVRTDLPEDTARYFMPLYEKAKKTRATVSFHEVSAPAPSGRHLCQSGYLIPRLHDDRVVRMICLAEEVAGRA